MKFQSFALIVCLAGFFYACDSSDDKTTVSDVKIDQMTTVIDPDMTKYIPIDMQAIEDQTVAVDLTMDMQQQIIVDMGDIVDAELVIADADIETDMLLEADMQQPEMLPEGKAFGQASAIAMGGVDLYYFEITEPKAVLLQTSSDGMGACVGLDTVMFLYRYQNQMRVEPEIDSNDDSNAGFCSKIIKVLEPGIYEVAVTGYNNGAVANYFLSISYPEIARLGESCDNGKVCEGGALCVQSTLICESSVPVILSANAYYQGNQFYLSGRGRDADLDSALLEGLVFLDDNDIRLYELDTALIDIFFTEEFDFSYTTEILDFDLSLATKLRFALSDFNGQLSEVLEIPLSNLPILSAGEACRTDETTGKCNGSLCVATMEGGATGVCTINTAPIVEQNTAVAYAQDVVLIVRLSGTDAENNINAIRIKYLDANNMPVLVDGLVENNMPIYRKRDNTYYIANVVFDLHPDIVSVEAKLVDEGNLSSEAVYLTLSPQPSLALDATCDAYLLDNNCGEYICDVFRFSPQDPPFFDEGTCKDIVPRITSAFTTRTGNNLFIKINGIDNDQNINQIGFHAINAQGQVIEFMGIADPLYFNPPVLTYSTTAIGEFTATIEINNLFVDIPEIDSVTLYALDQSGYQSNPYHTEIVARPIIGLGLACDSYRVENVCTANASCESNICSIPTPPTLQSATFSYNAALATPYLVIKIIATSGSAEISPKLLFTPKDNRGTVVPLVAGANILLLRNAALNELLPDGNRAYYFLLNNNLSSSIAQIELWMNDVNEVSSNHLNIFKDDTALNLQDNEICDANRYFGSCVTGLACSDSDGINTTALRCAVANPACPDSWLTYPLVSQDNQIWTYTGDSTNSASLTRGTCQGNGREDILTLSAPAGSYTVNIQADFDTVLYARDYCSSLLESNQLACNDDAMGVSPRSRIEFTLNQAQDIYLFVDAFSNDVGGPYTVTVTKQ